MLYYVCHICRTHFELRHQDRDPTLYWTEIMPIIRSYVPKWLRWLPLNGVIERLALALHKRQAERKCKAGHPGEHAPTNRTPTTMGFADAAPITLADFQVKNERRVAAFRMNLRDRSLMEWACELAEETGEVCGIAKKLARPPHATKPGLDSGGKPRPRISDLADELGDVITVAALVASREGIDLQVAVRNKWNNVSERVEWPERL